VRLVRAQASQGFLTKSSDVGPSDGDRPGGGSKLTRDKSEHGRLARPRRPKQRDRFSGLDLEVDPAERDDVPLGRGVEMDDSGKAHLYARRVQVRR
jgi:hypothetical protein